MDHQTEIKTDVPKTEIIRHEIEDTRYALADKLETLEHQVVDTVQETTSAVSETVDSVKEAVQETVEAVKDTVHDTVETVKGTVQQTVEAVKNTFDLRAHVENYPWPMFGGAVGLGYVLGAFLVPSSGGGRAAPSKTETNGAHVESNGRSHERHRRRHSLSKKHDSVLQGPLTALKNIAIGTAIGAVRELVRKNLEGDLGDQLVGWLDSVNEQLGGEMIQSPFASKEETDSQDGRDAERDVEHDVERSRILPRP